MSNQRMGVNQLLGVTSNRWPTNFFLRFSSCVLHEPLMHIIKRNFFHHFQMFLIVFDHANACPCTCSLVKIHNTSPLYTNFPAKKLQTTTTVGIWIVNIWIAYTSEYQTFAYLLLKWFPIQMPVTMVLGIWIADRYLNGGLNTGPFTKWWSEYWTAMVPGIW